MSNINELLLDSLFVIVNIVQSSKMRCLLRIQTHCPPVTQTVDCRGDKSSLDETKSCEYTRQRKEVVTKIVSHSNYVIVLQKRGYSNASYERVNRKGMRK